VTYAYDPPIYIGGHTVAYLRPYVTFIPLGSGARGGIDQYEGYLKGLVPRSTIPPKIYGFCHPKSSGPYGVSTYTVPGRATKVVSNTKE